MNKSEAGKRIKIARVIKGFTQSELAEKLGVKQASVALWENGRSFPRPGLLPKLSELLELSIDELLKAG